MTGIEKIAQSHGGIRIEAEGQPAVWLFPSEECTSIFYAECIKNNFSIWVSNNRAGLFVKRI